SDGWSMGVFLKELFVLYQSYCNGTDAQLPTLTSHYLDYSVWQQKWLDNDLVEKQLNYWKEELSGELPVLQLPIDYQRPAEQTFNGVQFISSIPSHLMQKIKDVCKKEGSTLFMTLLATYQGFLSRCTKQNDIVVGSPIANRNHPVLENMIGFFVNTIVYRSIMTEDMNFADLLSKTKEKALNAYANQDIPFEKIVDEIGADRSLSYSPVFQTMFVYQSKD